MSIQLSAPTATQNFIGLLKIYENEEILTWIRNKNRALGPFDIVELFGNASMQSTDFKSQDFGHRIKTSGYQS